MNGFDVLIENLIANYRSELEAGLKPSCVIYRIRITQSGGKVEESLKGSDEEISQVGADWWRHYGDDPNCAFFFFWVMTMLSKEDEEYEVGIQPTDSARTPCILIGSLSTHQEELTGSARLEKTADGTFTFGALNLHDLLYYQHMWNIAQQRYGNIA